MYWDIRRSCWCFAVGVIEIVLFPLCFLLQVSRGAEVIMLSKKVFLKYADQRCKLRVRAQIKVYPPEQVMQDNMQREADWSTYKECLLKDYVNNKMKHKVVDKQRSKSSTS